MDFTATILFYGHFMGQNFPCPFDKHLCFSHLYVRHYRPPDYCHFYQKSQLSEYRQVIKSALMKRNGVVDEEYVNAITEGLSIHINNQYFNFNTYFMFLTFSIFVANVYFLWDILEKKKEKQS